jgi:anti-sigma regulatory factor (Ser/Thr protein kinase)
MKRVEPLIALELPAEPHSAKVARDAIAGLDGHLGPAFGDVVLLISELVTNSVRHAGLGEEEKIRLRARSDAVCAYVEVCDAGRSGSVPDRREPGIDALEPGGLGLMLVDEMADCWGVSRDEEETCVWFELSCPA